MSEIVTQSLENLEKAVESVLARTAANKSDADSVSDLVGALQTVRATGVQTSGLRGQMLDAINVTLSDDAVDFCIYDTSQDSDGGAWRYDDTASWFNERLGTDTRGLRREFPAMALIVAEQSRVVIYDADDPSLPMWRAFQKSTGAFVSPYSLAKGVKATSGRLVFGGYKRGPYVIDFSNDKITSYTPQVYNRGTFARPISDCDTETTWTDDLGVGVVNSDVNDVAMTVLPDAPTDPDTGLQVPTIAVATDGGVSVIQNDGSVTNLTHETSANVISNYVAFGPDGLLHSSRGDVFLYSYDGIPTEDRAPDRWYDPSTASNGTDYLPPIDAPRGVVSMRDAVAIRTNGGLSILSENAEAPENGMIAHINKEYATGWLPGDIRGAWLASTDDTDLEGADTVEFSEPFDSGSGAFVAKDGATILTNVSGALRVENGDNTTSYASYGYSTATYTLKVISFDVVEDSGSGWLVHVHSRGLMQSSGTGSFEFYYYETDGTSVIRIGPDSTELGDYATFDNVRITDVGSDYDRSVYNNSLLVRGTIQREPVAPGAELVGYTGFGESDYLHAPIPIEGSGDFSMLMWARWDGSNVIQNLVNFSNIGQRETYGGVYLHDGEVHHEFDNSGQGVGLFVREGWNLIEASRKDGEVYFSLNGERAPNSRPFNDAIPANNGDIALVGINRIHTNPLLGALSLVRIGATAPTAEQIRHIYETERKLFEPGAQFTTGYSNILDLAYDPTTDLLHVATEAGRAAYDGIVKASEEPGSFYKIEAYNGMVVTK